VWGLLGGRGSTWLDLSRGGGGGHGRATGARDVGGAVRGGWGQSDCVE
jgi:hypothetical protein